MYIYPYMYIQIDLFTQIYFYTHTHTYIYDIVLLANTPIQAESLLHSLEQTAGGIGFHVNADKTEYMSSNQKGDIFTLVGGSLKSVDKFMYLRSSISSTENDIKI